MSQFLKPLFPATGAQQPPTSSSETIQTPEFTGSGQTVLESLLGEDRAKSPIPPVKSWSLTAVTTYEKCALRAKYRYVDKKVEARSSTAGRGVDYHKSVEDFLTGASATLPAELSFYHQWFSEVKSYEIYPEHKIGLTEEWTPTTWTEAWFRGVLDLKVVRRTGGHGSPLTATDEKEGRKANDTEPEEIIVYDWKTGKIYPDHDDQKSLYSLAAFAEHPSVRSVRAIHVYFDLGKIREKTFHKDQMHSLRAKWDDRARKYLKATENPQGMIPNPGYHCRYCAFSSTNGGPCRF